MRTMALTAENRHTGGKKGVKKPSRMLVDSRYVSETAASKAEKPDTPQQAWLRELKAKDGFAFGRQLASLEKEYRASNRGVEWEAEKESPATGAAAQVEDSGEERAVETMEGLLREMRGETTGRPVQADTIAKSRVV